MRQQTAVIIGAGPAGITAALEMVRNTRIKPLIIEATTEIGGLSRTVNYNGNRMDIGGHRFFSKSDRVMNWWRELMPVLEQDDERHRDVLLVRPRKSRIYFLAKLFDYPVQLKVQTFRNLGLVRTVRCGISYFIAALLPKRAEHSLEDFLINRFGQALYETFFKSYTEKVWGVPCSRISAEWGAQRIKGLSLRGVIHHYLQKVFRKCAPDGIAQKDTETSLIEQFLYPKYGPGQLWELAAEQVVNAGGEIVFGVTVTRLMIEKGRVIGVEGSDANGRTVHFSCDYVLSSMPVRDLIRSMGESVPSPVRQVSKGLVYRDFITVGLLVDRLAIQESDGSPLRDNWIYIQEGNVTVGRLQIFNNWSPALVADPSKVWVGMEYFCNERDQLWTKTDSEMAAFATAELHRMNLVAPGSVRDAHVVRVPKAYPAYFGSYDRFDVIREYVDQISNLFLIGRNGQHRYNNQDHSMLTAMEAVENLATDQVDKANIWDINTEADYHEEKATQTVREEERSAA